MRPKSGIIQTLGRELHGDEKTYCCQTGDINTCEERGNASTGLVGLAKPLESLIRNRYTSFLDSV